MSKYLSVDTEATGLEIDTHLIQLAFLPVDTATKTVATDLGIEWRVKCPSFEELKPKLNPWVIEHNEELIRKAHAEGIEPKNLGETVAAYLNSPKVKAFFGNERVVLLGKSLSALDIPLLTRYLTKPFMEKHFHHHTLDVTCVARSLVDAGKLPADSSSTSKLIKHFKIREDALHTALSDATDMAKVYFELIELIKASK